MIRTGYFRRLRKMNARGLLLRARAPARLLAREFRAQGWLVALIVTYLLAAMAVGWNIGKPVEIELYSGSVNGFLFVVLALSLSWRATRCMLARPERLFRTVWADWIAYFPRRVIVGIPFILLLPFFLSAFTSLKVLIPHLNPYGWDVLFIEIDRALHGTDPWRLLHPLLGHAPVTFVINLFYNLWLPAIWLVLMWQGFSLGPYRLRFLVSFVLVFALLGNLAATGLSSVGPCFVGPMYGISDFEPLMAYLNEANEVAPLWALDVQKYLWDRYTATSMEIGVGISAMPSIHVASASLMALLGWQVSRVLGILLTTFAIIVMLGSVHLAWHYAIDGYVGAIGAWIIWHAVGRFLGVERRNFALAPETPSR